MPQRVTGDLLAHSGWWLGAEGQSRWWEVEMDQDTFQSLGRLALPGPLECDSLKAGYEREDLSGGVDELCVVDAHAWGAV